MFDHHVATPAYTPDPNSGTNLRRAPPEPATPIAAMSFAVLRDRLDNRLTFINPTILEIWDLGPLQWTYHPDEEFKWSGYSEEGSAYIVDGDPVYRVVVS